MNEKYGVLILCVILEKVKKSNIVKRNKYNVKMDGVVEMDQAVDRTDRPC